MNVLESLLGILVVLTHVFAFAFFAQKILPQPLTKAGTCAVYGGIGFVCYAAEMYLLGWLKLWSPHTVLISFMALGCYLLTRAREVKDLLQLKRTAAPMSLRKKTLTLVIASMLAAIAVGAFGDSKFEDERGYHWNAPQQWAAAGRWHSVSLRYMNGACLTELGYLSSSLLGTDISARWTHGAYFILLLVAAAAIGEFLGCPNHITMAAVLAAPVFVNQSASAMSDDAMCSLLVASIIPFVNSYTTLRERHRRTARISSAVLLAGAVSIKPVLAFAALPSTLIFAGLQNWPKRSLFLSGCCVCLAVWLFWCAHTFALTGAPFDSNGITILQPSQSLKNHLEAVGKIPSPTDILTLPFVPAIASIFGQQEPFGGRIGLLIVPFGGLLLCVFKNAQQSQKQRVRAVALAACAYFFIVGLFTVRTRYLDFAWLLGTCLAAASYQLCQSDQSKIIRVGSAMLFAAGVLVGCLDSLHVLLNFHPTGQPAIKFLTGWGRLNNRLG